LSEPVDNQLMEIEVINNDIRASYRFMFMELTLLVETTYFYLDKEDLSINLFRIEEGNRFLSAFNELDFVTLDKRDLDKKYMSLIVKYYQEGILAFREENRYLSNWDSFISLLNEYSVYP